MNEHQRFQELELPNSIISTSRRLLSFFSKNTHSNMRLKDHVDVVGAIADCQGNFGGETSTDHVNDVSFLLWGNSTGKDYIHTVGGS